MKNVILLIVLLLNINAIAQMGVNATGSAPNPSAGLDVDFNDKGFLPPRLTTAQRNAILNPPAGLRIYNISTGCENYYSGITSAWMEICGTCPGPAAPTAAGSTSGNYQINWNWHSVPQATGYKWNTTNNYSTATNVGTDTFYNQTGLAPATNYNLYVWAYNGCGGSASPVTLSATTTQPLSRVFITSVTYQANFGGLSGADNICQTLATNQNLGGTWKAWLSTTNTPAANRLNHSSIAYALLDGTVIANNWADLTDGVLAAKINVDEQMGNTDGYVWTNTLGNGTVDGSNPSTTTCNEWTNNSGSNNGNVGHTVFYSSGGQWSDFTFIPCNFSASLYCFEQ